MAHLLNILKMIRRKAVAFNAAKTARMVLANPGAYDLGDEAAMCYDLECRMQEETTWRDVLPKAQWSALMAQARSRPGIVNEAESIEADDQRKEQLAIELRLMGAPNKGE